jgi:hypothetical protein
MKRYATRYFVIAMILVFFLVIASCTSNTATPDTASLQLAQTMVSLAETQTALAPAPVVATTAAPTANTTPMTPPTNTVGAVVHVIMPGNMQTTESTIDDVLYSNDNYNANLYERPYTEVNMVYRPDLDLQKVYMSTDNTFFYFALPVKDVDPNTKTVHGNYGVELDVDRDGRGDFLLWVYQTPGGAWDIAGVSLFTDLNNDVGGARPLLSDAPNKGDGYETEVWPGKPMTDPDGAWARIDPSSPLIVQIAVKRSLVGSPSSFMWSAWADDQLKAPYLFDYNDALTPVEAGSPLKTSTYYPLAKLAQIDNTCRGAWGFTPTGNEPGYCKPAVVPAPTKAPVKPTTAVITKTPVVVTIGPTPCVVQIAAQVTDGSTWDPSWASGVTLCIGSNCKHPDSSGYVLWYPAPGVYTITASSTYGITPSSAQVKLGCGEKTLTQFVIGPG